MQIISNFIIYALCDPKTNQIRYVGLSSNGLERPKRHMYPSVLKKWGHLKVYRWIAGLKKLGLVPEILIIEYVQNKEELLESEIFFISYFKSIGCRLLNLTAGGERFSSSAPWNKGKKWSIETRKKMSDAKKGKKQTPEAIEARACKTRGKSPTPEALQARINSNSQAIPIADQFGNTYRSVAFASKTLKIAHQTINEVLKGLRPSIRGLTFHYLK